MAGTHRDIRTRQSHIAETGKHVGQDQNNSTIIPTPINCIMDFSTNIEVMGIITSILPLKQITSKASQQKVDLFSFCLRDKRDSIRVVCWSNSALLYSKSLAVGDSVLVHGASIKKPTVGNGTTSPYELTVDSKNKASISLIDTIKINPRKPLKPTFLPLSQTYKYINSCVNLLCTISKVDPIQSITTKSGRLSNTQTIYLSDQTLSYFSLTFWGEHLELQTHDLVPNNVVLFENIKLKEYMNKPQGVFSLSSSFIIHPDMPQADSLSRWLTLNTIEEPSWLTEREKKRKERGESQRGKGDDVASITDYYCIKQLSELRDGSFGFLMVSLMDMTIKGVLYSGCIHCRRKLNLGSCANDKCNNVDGVTADYYVLKISVIDHSGSLHLVLFQDVAQNFVGLNAEEFKNLGLEEKEKLRMQKLWQRFRVCFKLVGVDPVKLSVLSCDPLTIQQATESLGHEE
eukprot:TRINITY_DN6985_c0_g1_i1.p1 TRINITY_DN6985_c0_g1~~TRINITY_DN6985_c0_g1_i1.p1  ORF type:complete len:459 (+),score=69.40 TRINITY_DN6985_c0_g1_i1:210-1586(+)